jgi:hypothetical protein
MEIHDMQNMRERIEWSKTWQGKYFNFLGYFFSLYCTWKIFISTVNIVFDRVGRVDPITKAMEIAVHWFGLDIDVLFWYDNSPNPQSGKSLKRRKRGWYHMCSGHNCGLSCLADIVNFLPLFQQPILQLVDNCTCSTISFPL